MGQSVPARSVRRWISNRRLFRIHGWLGINLGLLLFIVCFSGAVATLSREIEWLLNPAVRGHAADRHGSVRLVVEMVRRRARVASRRRRDRNRGARRPTVRWATRATVAYSEADWRLVFVDPYLSQVNGTFSEFGIPRFFRSFHKQFYIYPGVLPHGVYAIGPLGLILLLSLVTGLAFYRFRWRDLLMRGPWRSPRAFWSAFHRATGMWILPMAFLITFTGVWYFVERALEDGGVDIPSGVEPRPASAAPRSFWPIDLEEAIAIAGREVPSLQVKAVSFTPGPAPKITIRGQSDAWLVRDAANSVRMDPYTGRVESVGNATAMSVVARWAHTADPLHFGAFGGLTIKLAWCLAGLITSAAILLGVRVWYLRSIPANLGAEGGWGGALVSVRVTGVVLGVSLYGCLVNIRQALAYEPAGAYVGLDAPPLGDATVRVAVSSDGKRLAFRGAIAPAQRLELRRGWLWVSDAQRPATVPREATPVDAQWGALSASLDLAGHKTRSHLWLAAERGAGSIVMTGVPLGATADGTGTFEPQEIVPVSVWLVIALFAAICLGVAAAWLTWLHRQPATGRARVPVASGSATSRLTFDTGAKRM